MTILPDGWTRCAIGSICELINGRAFKPTDWSDIGLPIIRIQNLNNSHAKFNRFNGEVRSRFLIDHGALLFAWSGTPGTSFGAHIWTGGKAVLNQHIFNVLFDEKAIDKRFLRLAINQKLDELIDGAHGGVGLRHVTKGMFEGTEIDLPPLSTQRRLVAKLDSLFEHSVGTFENLKRIQRLIERYRQAVLSYALLGKLTAEWRTKTERSLEDWKSSSIGEIADVGTGSTPKRGNPRFYENGTIPWITSGAVNKPKVDNAEQMITEEALKKTNCKVFSPGTLLMAMYGEGQTRGKVAVLQIHAATNQALAAISIRDHSFICPDFVLWFLRANYLELRRQAAGGVQPNLNLGIVKSITLPVPTIEEQREIVKCIELLFRRIDHIEREASKAIILLDRLKRATLFKAFRGELVSHAPDDEPILIADKETLTELRGWPALEQGLTTTSKEPKTANATKGEVVAKTRRDVSDTYLTESLRTLGGSADASALWLSSDMEIDEFYKQLRDEIKAGRIEEGASKERLSVTDAD